MQLIKFNLNAFVVYLFYVGEHVAHRVMSLIWGPTYDSKPFIIMESKLEPTGFYYNWNELFYLFQ